MNEISWASTVVTMLQERMAEHDSRLRISQGSKLIYAYEILLYSDTKPISQHVAHYETDILIVEFSAVDRWKPRVVIECKLGGVTTHDAITYSQKALTHKNVHPYLRYSILLGNRKHYSLPGRLFRHGAHFDTMLSWTGYEPSNEEINTLVEVILSEVEASRRLEAIIFDSRSAKRERYTLLRRPLMLK